MRRSCLGASPGPVPCSGAGAPSPRSAGVAKEVAPGFCTGCGVETLHSALRIPHSAFVCAGCGAHFGSGRAAAIPRCGGVPVDGVTRRSTPPPAPPPERGLALSSRSPRGARAAAMHSALPATEYGGVGEAPRRPAPTVPADTTVLTPRLEGTRSTPSTCIHGSGRRDRPDVEIGGDPERPVPSCRDGDSRPHRPDD